MRRESDCRGTYLWDWKRMFGSCKKEYFFVKIQYGIYCTKIRWNIVSAPQFQIFALCGKVVEKYWEGRIGRLAGYAWIVSM